ncbi:hypothetical protein PPERSA_09912 [Pseudocohnilembus persalinus]|uniref:C2H2-type domain-containing protein n=1 Tax=Pseudocohnilembus persalinus TaxID=266149 RepID=A0A0V0QJB4_PSEPJ|nr:hypothetical protein PPERSA_09912 [Pseudocohnilembus persalinus]|eukprot:KRX02295.1 hypothetical protein PPERSA_09912 [Pseudocohnilembus persalinus]
MQYFDTQSTKNNINKSNDMTIFKQIRPPFYSPQIESNKQQNELQFKPQGTILFQDYQNLDKQQKEIFSNFSNITQKMQLTDEATNGNTLLPNNNIIQNNEFICDYQGCNYKTSKYITFWMHKTNKHSNKTYTCKNEDCSYTTQNKQAFENHSRYEHQDKIYHCEFEMCGFSTKNIKSYQYHCRTKHSKCVQKNKSGYHLAKKLQSEQPNQICDINQQNLFNINPNVFSQYQYGQQNWKNSEYKNKNEQINSISQNIECNITQPNTTYYCIFDQCTQKFQNQCELNNHYKQFMHMSLIYF